MTSLVTYSQKGQGLGLEHRSFTPACSPACSPSVPEGTKECAKARVEERGPMSSDFRGTISPLFNEFALTTLFRYFPSA